MQARHYVSVKIAIFSDDFERVMVMYYPKGDIYGLPGGHIDKGEDADTAMARELVEELGVTVPNAKRSDFFSTNRIILGYTAVVPADFQTYPSNPKKEHAVWCTKAELEAMDSLSEGYKSFILEQWPMLRQ